MAKACRTTDISLNPADAHGCTGCPHPVSGPAMTGSGDVQIEGQPALRAQGADQGVHAACCGPNTWVTMQGSGTVYINDLPVVRLGDATVHCGGVGAMTSSCGTVNVGG